MGVRLQWQLSLSGQPRCFVQYRNCSISQDVGGLYAGTAVFHVNGTVLWDNYGNIPTDNTYSHSNAKIWTAVVNTAEPGDQEYVFVSFCTV